MKKENSNGTNKIEIPLNSKTFNYALIFIVVSALLVLGINNIPAIFSLIKKVLSIFSPFIVGLCIAFILNTLLVPLEKGWDNLFNKIAKKGTSQKKLHPKTKRTVCLIFSIIILTGAIFAVIFMIVPALSKTISEFIPKIPSYIDNMENWWYSITLFFEKFNIILPEIEFDYGKIGDFINNFVTSYGENVIDKTMEITTSIISAAINFIIAFTFSIYILAQKELLGGQLRKLCYCSFNNNKVDKAFDFFKFTHSVFTKFISGQFVEALILGVLCFIGMSVIRLPYALVISIFIGVTALIPIFGAFVGNIIGAFLILLVNPLQVIWYEIFLLALQQVEGNLIYPKVVGKSIGLPGIWVLTAVTIGGRAFGVLGMLIGVPLCSVIYCTIKLAVNKKSVSEQNIL